MKGSKESRQSGAVTLTTSQPPPSKSTGYTKVQINGQALGGGGGQIQRKSSQLRTSVHMNSKTTQGSIGQEKTTSTSVKSRQTGGGSTSGHRQANPQLAGANSGKETIVSYTQYGLQKGSHRRTTTADKGPQGVASQFKASGGTPGNQVITSTSNLKSANAVMSNIQTHQKTKSINLTNSQGYQQMQASVASEGLVGIYESGHGAAGVHPVSKTTGNSGTTSKLMQKHQRHQSNPTWLVLQNSQQAQLVVHQVDKQPNISVQMPKTQHVTVGAPDSTSVNKQRSKQINQSSVVAGASTIQAHHSRFNSSMFGTQSNTSKIPKFNVSQANAAAPGNQSNSLIGNQGEVAAASTTTVSKPAGHKKSSSMANSKITQLLLKAGSKHYIQQQTLQQQHQQQCIQNPQIQRTLQQPSTTLPQKQLTKKSLTSQIAQEHQQLVSSFEVPTRSNNFMDDIAAKVNLQTDSRTKVYANINKSMDMVHQISAFNMQQLAMQQQQFGNNEESSQLQKILCVDGSGSDLVPGHESTYQEQLNMYLGGKTTKKGTQAAPHNKTADAQLTQKQIKQFMDLNRPTSIEVQQQYQNALGQQESAKNTGMVQQPMFFAQQLNSNVPVISTEPTQQKGVTNGEKIVKQGQIISSAGVSVAVKKPSSQHTKNLSVNAKGLSVTNQQNAPSQLKSHQRTKSDQHGGNNDLTQSINMGKIVQSQKGKVNEILQNNFIEVRQQVPGSVPQKQSGKAQTIRGIDIMVPKQVQTYTGGDRSKATNGPNDFTAATTTALSQKQILAVNNRDSQASKTSGSTSRKPSTAVTTSLVTQAAKKAVMAQQARVQQNTSNKTIYQKYEELESRYIELLEQLESKKGDVSGSSKQSQMTTGGPAGKRISPVEQMLMARDSQASQASLAVKSGGGGGQNQPQQQSHLNPRMIRYINNNQKLLKNSKPTVQQKQQPRDQLLGENPQNNWVRSNENKSADTHAIKHKPVIDMSDVMIATPFDDGLVNLVPNNSNRGEQSAPQDPSQLFAKRKSHNRVNTHYYGQKIAPVDRDRESSNEFSAQEMISEQNRGKLGNMELSQNRRTIDPSAAGNSKQTSLQGIINKRSSKATSYLNQNGVVQPGTTQAIETSTSRTQQTPRTISQSTENVDRIIKTRQQEAENIVRHTRMLYQNLVTVNHDQSSNDAGLMKQVILQNNGKHRRSVSDGNDPNNFNFKQGTAAVIPDNQNLKAQVAVAGGVQEEQRKQTLAHHTMQSKKRQESQKPSSTTQPQQRQERVKSTTRSQSRSKQKQLAQQHLLNGENIDSTSVNPDITSLESADNHHHPNSNMIFVQQDRKTHAVAKKISGSKHHPSQSLNLKESGGPKKGLKKPSTKGSGTTTSKLETKKPTHNRLKSNSYKLSNKDSSPLVAASSSQNDPSMEGSIQNPSTVVFNGRFIEMSQDLTKQKVVIKRGGGGSDVPQQVTFENSKHVLVDISTKEKDPNVANQVSNKRAFHHPALSQPNPWPNQASKASHDMFIVQERTPSTNSIGRVSSGSRIVYSIGMAKQRQQKEYQKNTLSPKPYQKKQHALNNLLQKSQGATQTQVLPYEIQGSQAPKTTERSIEQSYNQMSARELSGYIQVCGKTETRRAEGQQNPLERKRAGVSKNQAQEHPICQADGGARLGHIKNKLSNLSEKKTEAVGHVQNHRRHKSDNVENQSFQPLVNMAFVQSQSRGGVKQPNAKGGNPRGIVVKTAQISPNTTQKTGIFPDQKKIFLGNDDFYAKSECDDDKKLVNISIDELNQDEQQQERNDRSKWIEVIRENSGSGQFLHQRIVQQLQSDPKTKETSQSREQQVKEKRKKFMQAYQNQVGSKNDIMQNQETVESKDMIKKMMLPNNRRKSAHPQSVMLIEERASTDESYQGLPKENQYAKHKKLLNIAKNKYNKMKSKSQIPPHLMLKNSQASIEDDSSRASHQVFNASSAQELQKMQYEGIPADSFQESRRKISINMNILCDFQDHRDKFVSGHNAPTERSLVDSEKHIEPTVLKKKLQSNVQVSQKVSQKAPGKDVIVPLNSMGTEKETNLKAISKKPKVLFTSETDKKANAKKKSERTVKEPQPQQWMRIETYESIEHDSELTDKEKLQKKLRKYIRLGFQKNGSAPATTVDFYRVGKVLGKGAFGKVNLALHNLTQQMVAIKSINKQYFGEDSQRKKVLQEVVILKQTRHKHIVRLYEYFETAKHILFVIEIAAGGDLLNFVRKRRQLKEDMAKSLFKQLICGLHYCHSKGILHRDIKLDNILLSANGKVKICDFGVSKVIRRGEIMTEQCGTPAYIAPEILKDQGYEGFGVDIWSSGVVLYAMLYGIVPFRAGNMNELQKMIIRADYKLQDCISKEARDMLTGLLEKDPVKRLTTRAILAHPWMADAKDTFELFTQAEKNYIRSEYTYTDKSRYNRNTMTGEKEYESDAFVDAMLDTCENSILKNAETKSVILAPFNSTKSNIETSEEFLAQVASLLRDRRAVKYNPRVREIAKQYEVNNNAELDNGVQHDFLEEEAKAKAQEDAATGNPPPADIDQSDLKMFDRMIKDEESLQMSSRRGPDNKNDPYSCGEDSARGIGDIQPGGSHGLNNNSSSKLNPSEIGEAYNSLAPGASSQAGIAAQETLVVENHILDSILDYGFPREAVIQYLNQNELNSATASYWLLQMADQAAEEEAAKTAEEELRPPSRQGQKSPLQAHGDQH